jgi:hypothetical protein
MPDLNTTDHERDLDSPNPVEETVTHVFDARPGARTRSRTARPSKGSAEIEVMDQSGLEAYGTICGWTLARAHARSGDRIAIASYLGGGDAFDRAMTAFAETYADQNDCDYRALQDAVASRRVNAVSVE